MLIILAYYFISTIVPIDKVIGKIYPLFGIILIFMAFAVIIGIMAKSNEYPMLELIGNFHCFSKANGSLPWWPFMMTTVACGAVSGFHATQSPMIAKCIKSEKEGRQIFYGAMVAEGVIALIWAAAAMAFFKVNTKEGWEALNLIGGNSNSVNDISRGVLGKIGTILAIVGVVICPITSGDTALRSCRLIVGEKIKLNQKRVINRVILTIPLFTFVIGISIWNFTDAHNFNILWRWFAWSNQLLATICLWVSTGYLYKTNVRKYASLFTAIPALFMTMVVTTYILVEPELGLGRFIPYLLGVVIGIAISLLIFGFYLFKMISNTYRMEKDKQ